MGEVAAGRRGEAEPRVAQQLAPGCPAGGQVGGERGPVGGGTVGCHGAHVDPHVAGAEAQRVMITGA